MALTESTSAPTEHVNELPEREAAVSTRGATPTPTPSPTKGDIFTDHLPSNSKNKNNAPRPQESEPEREREREKKHQRAMAVVPPARRSRPSPPRLSDAELDIARKLSFSAALNHVDHEDHEDHGVDVHEDRVQIVIRMRPLPGAIAHVHDDQPEVTGETSTKKSSTSSSNEDDVCFRVLSSTALLAHPPKTSQAYRSTGTATSFQFTHIFSPHTAQSSLFAATTQPVLESAFQGRNGLVFAYGVTNSGKTYTITGTERHPGVLPQALSFVMDEMGRRKENDESPVVQIAASYLEIYNENVYDLLTPTPTTMTRRRRALRLQECDGKVQVRGMAERVIHSIQDAEDVLAMGQKNKQVAETRCNMDSSRSHCIFSLYLYHAVPRTTGSGKSPALALRSKVSIVDLAGSERSAKTGATGLRMQEASKINGSLMNLMRCLETLRWNQQHPVALHKMVPFRESKLTRLFQENLIGRTPGPIVMIVAVNPSSHEFDETLRTLKYSAMARELVPTGKHTLGRKQAAPAASTATYYDLDGRLRKRRRVSLDKTGANGRGEYIASRDDTNGSSAGADQPVGKANSASKRDSFGRHMKRSDKPALQHGGSRPPLRAIRPQADGDAMTPSAALLAAWEQEREAQRELMTQLELEKEDLRALLNQAITEKQQVETQSRAQALRAEGQLRAEKLQMEVQIRAEVGNEMRSQLQQIKAQYEGMLQRERTNNASKSTAAASKSSSPTGQSSSAMSSLSRDEERQELMEKNKQLQEQVRECEDEIKRIQERHQRELDRLAAASSSGMRTRRGSPRRRAYMQ